MYTVLLHILSSKPRYCSIFSITAQIRNVSHLISLFRVQYLASVGLVFLHLRAGTASKYLRKFWYGVHQRRVQYDDKIVAEIIGYFGENSRTTLKSWMRRTRFHFIMWKMFMEKINSQRELSYNFQKIKSRNPPKSV